VISPTSSRKHVPAFAVALVDHGAGERALHMAEELGFEHAFGQRAAIDRHEWTLRPRARGVDGPRDQLFSGAGLTLDEHRAPGSGHAPDHVEHVANRSRRADDLRRTTRRQFVGTARFTSNHSCLSSPFLHKNCP